MEDYLINCQCSRLKVELQQPRNGLIIVDVATGTIREPIHTTKGNWDDIMNPGVTP